MTLVYEKALDGPATHALVIGVGYYAHLLGGKGMLFPDHEGLKQLTSPPHSARAFAGWLLDGVDGYSNPDKPLASVELLISEAEDSRFALPQGEELAVERATFQKVSDALERWHARGDNQPENLMLFFFCGHGVARGYATSLLMEDFGQKPNNPLFHALSFRDFYEGMDTCQARRQCYFVDACRTASPALITRYNNYTGQPVIPGSAYLAAEGARTAPIFYATVPGTTAFGRPNQPSLFTEALLKAMKGAGSDDEDGSGNWRVDTDTLNRGLERWLRLAQGEAVGSAQVISVDELTKFTLHHLHGDPLVPVTVGCKPDAANAWAELKFSKADDPAADDTAAVTRPKTEAVDWLLELPPGSYHFSADFPSGGYQHKQEVCLVRPPSRKVTLGVSP